jgi:hypothetical protein
MASMNVDLFRKWEGIIDDVEKSKIPIHFIKKIVCKLEGKRQHTINIQALFKQGMKDDEVEDVVGRKMAELDAEVGVNNIEFILDVKKIADEVQPETDKMLNKLSKAE